jgi:predicted ABC-type sugar transport system permease subunit
VLLEACTSGSRTRSSTCPYGAWSSPRWAVGTGVGAVNGVLVTRFSVAPFIATPGTLYMARGAALLISGGETYPNLGGSPQLGNTGFDFLGSGRIAGIPTAIRLKTSQRRIDRAAPRRLKATGASRSSM